MCRSVRGFQWLQAKNGKIQLQKKNQVKKGAVHKRSFRAHEQKKKVKKVLLSLQNTWVQEKILGLATKTLECQQRQKQ